MTARLACIVEGHGEVPAVPVLVRRICEIETPTLTLTIFPAIRVSRTKVVKEGELERAVELASRKVGSQGAVLILLDAEDDCPRELAPTLIRRATAQRSNIRLGVVLANREFENWFLAAAASLRSKRGLPDDLEPPSNPEAIRGAKEWLGRYLGRRYAETVDQPAFAQDFDLTTARTAPSFDKCYREIAHLLRSLDQSLRSPSNTS